MERLPSFPKSNNIQKQKCRRNFWCPLYSDCVGEAARLNSLLDCSSCEQSTIDYEDDWKYEYLNSVICLPNSHN